jgi:uncharacterized protein
LDDLPFRSYSRYLRERYGERAYRVAVDAGFSCPHRDRRRDGTGCTFCECTGSRAPYLGDAVSLEEQVSGSIRFLSRRYKARVFLLYFQAFSGTYADPRTLARLYDYGLSLASFRELIVSTRPDCVDEERADLLSSYRTSQRDVWVELGLQSANDETLARIRREHTVEQFDSAYTMLKERGVKVAVHLVYGLPGEGLSEIRRTVRHVARLNPDGVKIHNLHVPYDAPMFLEFLRGELTVPSPERHLRYVAETLPLLPPDTLIMRLTCDTPAERLAAPRRFWVKSRFHEEVAALLRQRREPQGSRRDEPATFD